MRRPLHLRHARLHAGPTWFRLLARLCVLLIAVSACVQASHVHDDGGPALWKSSQGKTPGHTPGSTPANTPDHCLLCVVMHAAMPSARGFAPVPIRYAQPAIRAVAVVRRAQRISFDLFSRPPPARTTHATEAGLAGELRAL